MDKIQGFVYLVGAGPGDRNLITRKALDCLFTCDTVVYDYLATDRLLEEVGPDCEKIYVGKKAGCHTMAQEEINQILIAKAKEGKKVVRLKGGDPMVFGRGGEEALALKQERIPFEIVPGVTSVTAALSSAGIPVTHRGLSRSFHVMTGHTLGKEGGLPEDFSLFARCPGTLIFLMGLNNMEQIVEGLLQQGKEGGTPAAVIENGTLPEQRVVRGSLKNIAELVKEQGIHAPAIIVVGAVAALSLESEVQSPLKKIKCGLVGTDSFVNKLTKALESKGADTRHLISMSMIPSDDKEILDALEEISDFTWLVFTSVNAVRLFFGILWNSGKDYRVLGNLKFAVAGSGTEKELEKYGIRADFIPSQYCSTVLGEELSQMLKAADRVLIPRAAGGSSSLTKALSDRRIYVRDIILYHIGNSNNVPLDFVKKVTECDYVILGSSLGAEAYLAAVGGEQIADNRKPKLVSIGSKTRETLCGCNMEPEITAKEFCVEGLLKAIEEDAQAWLQADKRSESL